MGTAALAAGTRPHAHGHVLPNDSCCEGFYGCGLPLSLCACLAPRQPLEVAGLTVDPAVGFSNVVRIVPTSPQHVTAEEHRRARDPQDTAIRWALVRHAVVRYLAHYKIAGTPSGLDAQRSLDAVTRALTPIEYAKYLEIAEWERVQRWRARGLLRTEARPSPHGADCPCEGYCETYGNDPLETT
jgi:hypothetical protein